MISKKLKVMMLKNNKLLVKVPSLDSIQSSLLSMVKLETHLILLDNSKQEKLLDLMISLKISICSYNVTILSEMTP